MKPEFFSSHCDRENWIPASELTKLQRTKWLMKLSSNILKKWITWKRMLHMIQFHRLNIVTSFYTASSFCVVYHYGLFIQIFALKLYHFAFRISIMLHEIDINKNPFQSFFSLSLFTFSLSPERVCIARTISTGFLKLLFISKFEYVR